VRRTLFPRVLSAAPEPGTVFRVVMAYADFVSGKRAMDTCNFLVRQMGGGVELRSSMWKFDVLRSAKLSQIAVDDAVDADVIIVANARNTGLPEEVREWIKGWVLRKRNHAAALVALLDFTNDGAPESAQTLAFLKGAAAAAKIDFLPQEIRFLPGRMPFAPESPLSDWSGPPADPSIGRRSPEAWGIND
jgi:hypothetical protein